MTENKTDYKDTLNLPETGFPMKADLTRREPLMLEQWIEKRIHEMMLEKNRGGEAFILHDGPPYANGHIHMGHTLNKVLKDIVVKFKGMKGFYSPYVPGWDCHGLPIELQVDKGLGKDKDSVEVTDKRKLCREYAMKFVDIQRNEFMRLGVFGFWSEPYLTMTNAYEGAIARELVRFVKDGYVYKGKKPVHWCPSCVTALAEAEVEYAEKESPSVFVRFLLNGTDAEKLGLGNGNAYLVIWTTTPWTLPANLALAVSPSIEYAAVKNAEGTYIVARDLLESLRTRAHIEGDVVKVITGAELEGMEASHPFINRKSKVITGDFVSVEEGSGIVHIAPGHGEDDYEAGLRNGLDVYAPVDDHGKFVSTGVAEIDGMFVFKANRTIIDILNNGGNLLGEESISHSYPHCWRCKKPVIFRATEQWFISMEHEGLRKRCLDEIDRVNWVPSWGRERIHGMVSNRPDWCISRQRSWGVPITLLKCDGCGDSITDPQVLDNIVSMITVNGSDVWFERDAAEFLTPGFTCPRCGGGSFSKEKDILDVWFDSGVSHAAVLELDDRLSWPADLYLEGSDQHRGWFQSSLIASTGTRKRAPYGTVLTHGFVVDGKGKKMSKSLGNVISPEDIIKQNGAELLRLWVSAEDYRDDIRLSKEIMDRLREAYRKIRNTARFLLGNTHDFDGGDYSGDLMEIDRWAMSRLQGLIKRVDEAYERFDFHEVYHRLYNFCIVDMSSFYLDILKDRLYTYRKDSRERRAAQWVMHRVLMTMTGLMAPVLSFTAEEIWGFIKDSGSESVFLSEFPNYDGSYYDASIEQRWAKLITVRDEVNKALELKRQAREIGNALEAKVIIHLPDGETLGLLKEYSAFLPTLFIVSQAEAVGGSAPEGSYMSTEVEGMGVAVSRAEGMKCQRCWNWSPTVGTIEGTPGICDRCSENIK